MLGLNYNKANLIHSLNPCLNTIDWTEIDWHQIYRIMETYLKFIAIAVILNSIGTHKILQIIF